LAVSRQEALVAYVDVAEAPTQRFNLIFLVDVDDSPAPLAITAHAHEAGVAQPHVGFLTRQHRLARIALASSHKNNRTPFQGDCQAPPEYRNPVGLKQIR